MEEFIKDITETAEGYPVRNLRWNPLENIILGQVRDPLFLNNLNDGYSNSKWRKNGSCLKEKNRPDLKLKINF